MIAAKNIVLYNRAIFILSLLGFFIAIYVLQSFVRQTSIVCVNTGCELVRKNPASYPFGIPVPAFGLIGYACLVILSFWRTMSKKPWLLKGSLGIAIFGVCFTLWFTYTEIFVIGAVCTWCAISTVNMFVIFLLTIFSFKAKSRF